MKQLFRHLLEIAICCLLAALTAVVFSQVIARYFLHAPLSWSEELARFLLMWLAMLSAAYAFRTKSHFALRIIVKQFSTDARFRVSIAVHLITTAFFLLILYQGVVYVRTYRTCFADSDGNSLFIDCCGQCFDCLGKCQGNHPGI